MLWDYGHENVIVLRVPELLVLTLVRFWILTNGAVFARQQRRETPVQPVCNLRDRK